jgi:hypothetical protein
MQRPMHCFRFLTDIDAVLRRWLRLLFTREFPLDEAMMLWDGLLACDPTFELAEWVCVAMLLRIRNKREAPSYVRVWLGQFIF